MTDVICVSRRHDFWDRVVVNQTHNSLVDLLTDVGFPRTVVTAHNALVVVRDLDLELLVVTNCQRTFASERTARGFRVLVVVCFLAEQVEVLLDAKDDA